MLRKAFSLLSTWTFPRSSGCLCIQSLWIPAMLSLISPGFCPPHQGLRKPEHQWRRAAGSQNSQQQKSFAQYFKALSLDLKSQCCSYAFWFEALTETKLSMLVMKCLCCFFFLRHLAALAGLQLKLPGRKTTFKTQVLLRALQVDPVFRQGVINISNLKKIYLFQTMQ